MKNISLILFIVFLLGCGGDSKVDNRSNNSGHPNDNRPTRNDHDLKINIKNQSYKSPNPSKKMLEDNNKNWNELKKQILQNKRNKLKYSYKIVKNYRKKWTKENPDELIKIISNLIYSDSPKIRMYGMKALFITQWSWLYVMNDLELPEERFTLYKLKNNYPDLFEESKRIYRDKTGVYPVDLFSNKNVLEAFKTLIEDKYPETRRVCIHVLTHYMSKPTSIVGKLIRQYKKEKSSGDSLQVKVIILRFFILRNVVNQEIKRLVFREIKHEKQKISKTAIGAVGELKLKGGIPKLLNLYPRKDNDINKLILDSMKLYKEEGANYIDEMEEKRKKLKRKEGKNMKYKKFNKTIRYFKEFKK